MLRRVGTGVRGLRVDFVLRPQEGRLVGERHALRDAFPRESELLVGEALRHDRPATDLLAPGHAYLNKRLARHHSLPGVRGSQFRRVALPNGVRGGLLRQGSVLSVTSYATPTSPVLRGA